MGQQFVQAAVSLGWDWPSSQSLTLNHSLEAGLVEELSAQQISEEICENVLGSWKHTVPT